MVSSRRRTSTTVRCIAPADSRRWKYRVWDNFVLHGVAPTNERQYRSMPTHGIGRWKYLLPKEAPRKKRDRLQMKQIRAATDTEYGSLSVKVSGYDMTVVEHYSQYIHNLCNRLRIRVAESYALPTKTTAVMLMQEQGTKMYVDALLKTHERIVQISSMNATLCPTCMDVVLQNQPEGVELTVKEHAERDFLERFKARPQLEGLMAQVNQRD
ncbi:39S ribosomal protein L48, mitochondrial [Merluccius polli]|uniref:Large ribosomal subunit protein mL48 n=1 Tax=Merluccius polli TaxID=89951 RepID=A0AA47NZI8_MERPO|nr:39S ribosomal protein L48, mitochondrial [Merluccius polli]